MEGHAISPGTGPHGQTHQQQAYSPSDYSTLEVAPNRAPHAGPEVVYEPGLEHAAAGYYAPHKAPNGATSDTSPSVVGYQTADPSEKYLVGNTLNHHLAPVDPESAPGGEEQPRKAAAMSSRKKWILIIIAVVVVVAVAVGGGVGGSIAARNQSASNEAASSSSNGNSDNSNNNGNNNGGSTTPPQSPSPNTGGTALGSSALAAVNYTIDGTDYRMVFWQPRKSDTDIVYSLLDSSQQPAEGWKTISISSKLAEGAVEAKPGTAIAAVLRPRVGGSQHALSVFYLSASSVIQEVRTNDARGAKWEKFTHSKTAAQNSQLAGRWDVCGNSKCSNLTALVYETERNEVAWYWPGLPEKSPLEPLTASFKSKIIPGSGLSLTMTMDPGSDGNTAEQNLKLYYQNATAKSLWEITRNVNSTYFITQTKLATDLPERNPSQIYATSFYKDSPAEYVFIVIRAADGTLQTLHWNLDMWRLPRDPVYRNAPADVGNKFGAVSVTNDMRIYALAQDGNGVHVFNADKIDPITWTYETAFQLS